MTDRASFEPASFRDRGGRIVHHDGRILRCLNERMAACWRALEGTRFFPAAVDAGRIVPTRACETSAAELGLPEPERWPLVLEHEPIPVISYPYEWCFGMLKDAALLQLELLEAALAEGLVSKDGTAYNVQWRGARPQFIDTGSFEPLAGESVWTGYRQFCQLFLYPLMLQAYRGVPFQPLLRGSLDGVTPEVANHLFSVRDRFRAGVFSQVYLQALLQRRMGDSPRNLQQEVRRSDLGTTLIRNNVRRLLKLVRRLEWNPPGSEWGDYARTHGYDDADEARKGAFVEDAARRGRPATTWDLGANTGHYSRLAAPHSGYVLALDADQLAVERNYRALREGGPDNILPLVGNVADPAPAIGWRLAERPPLEDRSRPELVLALALVHHVVITANIPLAQFVDWLADLGATLVIEFVDRGDPMARRLLRNRPDVDDYHRDRFEDRLERRFTVEETLALAAGQRILYRCRPRGART